MGIAGLILNWLATHLVSMGFLGFLLVAVLFRHAIFELETQPGSPTPVLPDAGVDSPGPADLSESAVAPAAPASDEAEPDARQEAPGVTGVQPGSGPGPGGRTANSGVQPVFRPAPTDVESDAAAANAESPRFRDPVKQPVILKEETDKRADRWLGRARDAFSAEHLEQAEAHYLRYLSLRPENAEAFAELGNLYQAMERTRDAMDAYYEAAIRFGERGNRVEVEQLGQILERAGDSRGALLLSRIR